MTSSRRIPWSLSVVDQSPVRVGGTGADALRETIDLASAAERFGYSRYWVAEHHGTPSLAATSPAIMVGQIAARTRRIRVGSGGVLLSNYSALQVAENFRVLESLYPGRIDLGLGRASGGDRRVAAALASPSRDRDNHQYAEQVDDLITYLTDERATPDRHAGIRAGPTVGGTVPEVWLLGSGVESAHLAARRGLPLSLAHFLTNGQTQGPAVVEQYRRAFQPSSLLAAPKVNIAVSVVCAESGAAAEELASSLWLRQVRSARGQDGPLVSPAQARAELRAPDSFALVRQTRQSHVVGSPDQVRTALEQIAGLYDVTDLSVITICYSFEARVRSYELVAQACGLAD